MEKSICMIGGSPDVLYGYENKKKYDSLFPEIKKTLQLLTHDNYTEFVTGGTPGFEQLCFWAVEQLKKENHSIKNILYLPCKDITKIYPDNPVFGKNDLKLMMSRADRLVYAGDGAYRKELNIQKTCSMIENTQSVLALYQGNNWTGDNEECAEYIRYAIGENKNVFQMNYTDKNIISSFQTRRIHEYASLFGIEKGIICQQVNCRGVMGAGLAKVIADQYPIVKQQYLKEYKNNKDMLFNGTDLVYINDNLCVANIYSQFDYGNAAKTKIKYTDEKVLLYNIDELSRAFPEKHIYIPVKIGCGYGGGDWDMILNGLKKMNRKNLILLDTHTGKTKSICNGNKQRTITKDVEAEI